MVIDGDIANVTVIQALGQEILVFFEENIGPEGVDVGVTVIEGGKNVRFAGQHVSRHDCFGAVGALP